MTKQECYEKFNVPELRNENETVFAACKIFRQALHSAMFDAVEFDRTPYTGDCARFVILNAMNFVLNT